jgi:hypothetical protein
VRRRAEKSTLGAGVPQLSALSSNPTLFLKVNLLFLKRWRQGCRLFTMKAGYKLLLPQMADEPDKPEPTPIPIRIVKDRPPSKGSDSEKAVQDETNGKRNDFFYEAWDKFLAIEPKRAKKTSKIVRKTEEKKAKVKQGSGEGLQVRENAATSYEQAAAECRAKVAAIVEECARLNQKYRDAVFDLEASRWCLQSLNGAFPKAVENIDEPPWIKVS